MAEIIQSWAEQPDGTHKLADTIIVFQPGIDGWSTCNLDKPLPTSCRHDWRCCFGEMVGAACEVEQCIAHRSRRENITDHPSPVLCMLGWSIRCSRLVASELTRLRIARLGLPTPPEMSGTESESFCEQIVSEVDQRCTWLLYFVTHTKTSLNLPIDERLAHESNQICEQFTDVAARWKFEPINAREWMRRIELELGKCDWLTADEQTPKPTIPPAEKLPFALQRCDVPRWLKRPGFDKLVEIPEVYSAVMEALMAAAPNAVTDAKKDHLKASGYDTKKNSKKTPLRYRRDRSDHRRLDAERTRKLRLSEIAYEDMNRIPSI